MTSPLALPWFRKPSVPYPWRVVQWPLLLKGWRSRLGADASGGNGDNRTKSYTLGLGVDQKVTLGRFNRSNAAIIGRNQEWTMPVG